MENTRTDFDALLLVHNISPDVARALRVWLFRLLSLNPNYSEVRSPKGSN